MALTLSLDNKSAIVTGGASGIGKATALLLAEAGANVTVFDIDDARAAGLESKSIMYRHCDMSNPREIDLSFNDFIAKHKKIDILINNVAMWMPGGDILEMPDDIIAKMEAVNVVGPRHITRLAMNNMKTKGSGGSIVFVASTQAHVVDGSPTIYNVEKNTVLGMAKTFAIAGGPFGIRVNAILPGAIATEGMGVAEAVGKDRILAGNHKTPLGRRGRPDEVAFEIVNLCFATYTTGDMRTVDGGFSKVALPVELDVSYKDTPGDPDADFIKKV